MNRKCIKVSGNMLLGHATLPANKVTELEFEGLMKVYY